jgi:hypothetical protein
LKKELIKKYKRIKYTKLIAAIIIDLIGNASYFLPVVGEGADIVWGLLSGGILMSALFPNHKKGAAINVVEEILPGTDIVPTASILWLIDYMINNKKTFENFVRSEVNQHKLIHNELNSDL